MLLNENLELVKQQLAEATLRSGRSENTVTLIAVCKTKPIDLVQEAWNCGQKDFAENYVQELVEKAPQIPEANWHFIGTLQSNKVAKVVGLCGLIQSVDRLALAEKINQVAGDRSLRQDILLQIHVGDEATKHGVSPGDAVEAAVRLSNLRSIRLRGLMSMPPLTDDERLARSGFAELRELHGRIRQQLAKKDVPDFDILSMGTTSDFEWAILEGSTMVRVGTAIFGRREAKTTI